MQRLPACTRARIDATAGSNQIDQEVKAFLSEALALYEVDVERLKALCPDFILTQAQCEVCAVSLPEVEASLAEWTCIKPQVISLSPSKLEDVWQDVRNVANVLGAPQRGVDLIQTLRERVEKIVRNVAPSPERPSVACIEWLDPLMAAGNWVPELVELAGGRNLFGQAGAHSDWLKWEELCEQDPDVIVMMPCGFDLDRVRRESATLIQKAAWRKLRAARSGRVFAVDGNQYFNRPGPRLVESLEIVAEIIRPSVFPPSHRGQGWEKLERHTAATPPVKPFS